MIKTVLRTEIFEKNKNITAVINKLQDFSVPDYEETEEEIAERITSNDTVNISVENMESYYNVISFDHSDINTFTEELTKRLIDLLTVLGIREVYIVSHLKMNLLGCKKNTYKPLKNALLRFEKLIGMPNNDEAFEVDLIDFPQCIETFFWLERCDPSAPEYVFFANKEDDFSFYLCKDGNVHTIAFEKEKLTQEVLENTGWQFLNEGCNDKFSEDNAIEGRRLSFEKSSLFSIETLLNKFDNLKILFSHS